ncbi:hypothetical protein ACTFIV_003928 [Dictyostelium citrinum]
MTNKNNNKDNQLELEHTKKKQKLNHKENNETTAEIINLTTTATTFKLEDLNLDELNKFKLVELNEIVKSFSIKTGKKKKSELIEIIKEEISNGKLLKQENENQISNPFQRNCQELLNKDVDNEELLFWKVFKNKFLFKTIVSKLEFKCFSKSYESMISVYQLLSNNKISIVKDKVNNNDKYLVFSHSNDTSSGFYNTYGALFSKFQTDDLDTFNFFKNLFKNYGNRFIEELTYLKSYDDEDCSGYDDKYFCSSDFIKTMIMYNCVPAVKVLMNEFNFVPTINSFFTKVVEYGSLPILKFLLIEDENQKRREKLISQLKSKKTHQPIWEEASSSMLFQGFYGLLNMNYKKEKYETILFLLENNFLKRPEKTDVIVSLYSTSPITNYLLLKDLILACKLLDKILDLPNNNNNYYDEISKKFTNQQLDSMLRDPINWESNEITNKKIIKDLLNHWYKESKTSRIDYEFYVCFDKLENDKETRSVIKTNLIIALKYGNIEILLKSLRNRIVLVELERIIIPHNLTNNQSKPNNHLFSHCNCKEKQKQFISSWVDYINGDSDSNGSAINGSLFFLFLFLIQNDDIELLKLSIDKLKEKSIFNFYKPNLIISDYIKSVEMLEFLYKEYGSIIFKPCLQSFLLYLSNDELLKCFEKLENLSSKRRIILSNKNDKKDGLSLSTIQHIIKNVENIYDTREFTFNIASYDNENDRDQLISLLKYIVNFKATTDGGEGGCGSAITQDIKIYTFIIYFYNFLLLNQIPHFKILKFMDWLISINFPISNDVGGVVNENSLKIFKYLVGRTNEIHQFFPDNWKTIGNLFPLANYIVLKCDTNTLDLIMNEINSKKVDTEISSFILHLLEFASEIGQLKILEHIKLHYSHLFNKKSKGGWFSQSDFNSLINKSIRSNHINCTEFLLQYSTISQLQFKKITSKSGISYSYFKNKIK